LTTPHCDRIGKESVVVMDRRAADIARQSFLCHGNHASFSESRGGHDRQEGFSLGFAHDHGKRMLSNDCNRGRSLFFIGVGADRMNAAQERFEVLNLAQGQGENTTP